MPTFHFQEVLLLIFATLALVNSLLIIFVSRLNRKSRWFLAIHFLGFGLSMVVYIFKTRAVQYGLEWNLFGKFFGDVNILVYYGFINSALFSDFQLRKQPYLLILPVFAFLLFLLTLLFPTAENLIAAFHTIAKSKALFSIRTLFWIYILISSYFSIRRYNRQVNDTFSNLSEHQHQWLMRIWWANVFYCTFLLSWNVVFSFIDLPPGYPDTNLLAGLVVLIYLLYTLVTTLIYSTHTQTIEKPVKKSGQTSSNHAELENLYQRIRKLMMEKKSYEQPDLKLDTLASNLEIPPRLLSNAINTCGNKNFYEFVNDFRIEAAKTVLASHQDSGLTIQEVMYDVGYNSKSSFNTAFKRITGLTPLQYRRKMSSNT